MTADDSKEENSVREVGNCVKIRYGFQDKKSSGTTDSCRGCAFGGSGKTNESVVRWGAGSKFSEGRTRFYPGFSKTENIRIVGVDEI